MSKFTLFSLEQIKREAKKIKKQYPDLSHTKRLDIAAKNILKVANYHQAISCVKNSVNSMYDVSDEDGFAVCRYCNMEFYPDEPEDVETHNEIHLKYEQAQYGLGFLPAPYKEREKSKKQAYSDLSADNSFDEKFNAALRLIRGHFDRSLDKAIMNDYWRKHPTFDQYVAMVDDYEEFVPTDVMRRIRVVYGKQSGKIAEGRSYWLPVVG